MNKLKAVEISVLKRLAAASRPGTAFRRLYNRERLQSYRGQLMKREDIDRAHSLSRDARKAITQEYQKRYRALWEETANRALSILERVQIGGTEKAEVAEDILFCKFAYGFEPEEYFGYHFWDRSDAERQAFVSDRELMYMVYQMNDRVDIQNFNDKARTFALFGAYYRRDCMVVSDPSDYDDYCAFIQRHPSFVKKKVNEAMGRSVELITVDPAHTREQFDRIIKAGKHLLEERIEQDGALGAFHESSVNTLRLITFHTREEIVVPFGFMKFGRKGSFVDNGGAGGIVVGVDLQSGTLFPRGCDEEGNIYGEHPDSHVPFRGFVLPQFHKAIAMAKELSMMTPTVQYIGWDLACSAGQQWIVVEGNGMSQLVGPQMTLQKGMKTEVKRIMSNMDLVDG